MERLRRKGKSHALQAETELGAATVENSMFLKKLKIELPYDHAISLWDIYMKRMKSLSWRDIWTLMFTVILFTIAKIWKEPKCSSRSERMKKMWCLSVYLSISIYLMEYYSALRKKEILPFETTWVDLEVIMLNKSEKESQIWPHLYVELNNLGLIETENRMIISMASKLELMRGMLVKDCKRWSVRWKSSEDLIDSITTTVNNTVLYTWRLL